ncbi:MAG: MATE family efflux transporter [Muribaculaceae bacterium]
MKIDELAHKSIGRLLWEYSIPSVVGMIVVSMYNIIDRVIIGQQVGAAAITGLTVTFPVMNLTTAFGTLVGVGSAARVSILLGQKRNAEADNVLGNALILTLVLGALYLIFFAIYLDDILRAFGASDVTLPYAHDFMSTLLPGLLLMNLTWSFNNIQRASGYPRRAMAAMLISTGVNLVLALIFVLGLKMGIRGAALATDIAMFTAMVFVMWHFMQKESIVRFRRGIYRLRGSIIISIVSIGAAPALINAVGCLINILLNNELKHSGGDMAIGAAGLFVTYTQLILMVVIGICQGMQPIVGYNYGAGNWYRMKRAYKYAVYASTVLCTAGCIIGITMPDLIARAFNPDPELVAATVRCLHHALLAFMVVGYQVVSTNFFQSIGKAGKSILLSLTRQAIFLIPLMLWLPSLLGLNGIWLSFPISDILATIVTFILIKMQFRQFSRMPVVNNQ